MNEGEQKKQAKVIPVYKKWWFWVIVVVLVIGVAGVAGSSKNDEPHKIEDGSSEQDAGSDSSDSADTFKVGDTISVDKQEMTVVGVERNWSAEYSKPKDGKEYIRVTVRLENKGSDKLSYYSSMWKVENKDGAIDDPAFVLGNDTSMDSGELAPNGKKEGTIVYEIPKGDVNLKLHYRPGMFSSKDVVVELQ